MTDTTVIPTRVAVVSRQIMTSIASAIHLRMIYCEHWRPGRGAMTGLTQTRGINVATRQAVATTTGAGAVHFIVIYCKYGRPRGCSMTGFAHVRRIDMATRQIMATGTGAGTV